MKIDKNLPVQRHQTKKASPSGGGDFRILMQSHAQAVTPAGEHRPNHDGDSRMQTEAWLAISRCIGLLDEALEELQQGQVPSEKLLEEIDHLRENIRERLAGVSNAVDLDQAHTLLAVEAARIRHTSS